MQEDLLKKKAFSFCTGPDLIEGGKRITAGIYLGGDIHQAIAAINQQQIDEKDIKLFIGYCGWDAGQLTEELAEGSWLPLDASIEQLFFNVAALDWQLLLPE